MRGAIVGDVIGSVYEGRPVKHTDFPLFQSASCFTDDTVLAVAVAEAFYGGVPEVIRKETAQRLDPPLLDTANRFTAWTGV